jgi:hypothetical protein
MGQSCVVRGFMIFTPTKYYLGHQINEKEMGRACDTYGRDKKYIQGLGMKPTGKM